MNSCAKGTVFGPLRDRENRNGYLRVDCKKLTCERCGPKRARRYRISIGKNAEEHRLNRMMSLTLDPKKCTVEDSVSYLRECFSKFRVSLLRRFRKAISYIAVVELQKSGMAHLHVLIGVYIDQRWISEAWESVGGGSIVDIRLVDVHRVKAYLSKYLTKDFFGSVPAKKKRVTTSRDIHLSEKKEPSGWTWSRASIAHYLFKHRFTRGFTIGEVVEDDAGLRSFVLIEAARSESRSFQPCPLLQEETC